MKTKLSPRFWCALIFLSLTGQVAWVVENMYLNVFIYKMFNASAGDISLMVAASAVAATVTTVFIGALSDKLGKRKLFICAGYILWGVSVMCFGLLRLDVLGAVFPLAASAASVGVSLTIILDCVMTFFGSSANDAAFNAWLTDRTDVTNRGAAEGVNAMMPLVAMLAVFGGFMAFDLDRQESWQLIFAVIGGAVILVGVLGFFLVDDRSAAKSESGYLENVIYGFRLSTVRENAGFYFSLLCFIIFNISIQIFMPYLIIYYEVSLGMANYVPVLAPAVIIAAAVTVFWGKAYDKKGFAATSVSALVVLMLGYVLLYFLRTVVPVFIGSLLMMCGYLAGMAVFGARIRDLTPSGKAGRLQGVRIFSQVLIPGVVGPYIGKAVLSGASTILNSDGTYSFVPSPDIFLAAIVPAAVVLLLLVFTKNEKSVRLCSLYTPFEKGASDDWREYPRPQLKRASYVSLCGQWELSIRREGEESPLGGIQVPFPPESRLSGIERQLGENEQYIYRRCFELSREVPNGRVRLHFGAVDQTARVFVNGKPAGEHTGGYLPFTLDITELLTDGENELTVEVTDKLDHDLPWGKQRRHRGGMWYTPISGIWQPVWLEEVPKNYIRSLKMTPTISGVTVEVTGGEEEKIILLQTGEEEREISFRGDSVTIEIDAPRLWTPEDPYLYSFTLTSGEDRVESYFALRTVTVEKVNGQSCICLNGRPMFFHGLLDQGYYSDGIYTPASPKGYEFDILTMKKLGFNMLRKHIKIEPDLFYYYCDKYGMIVFQDMVNSGEYSFVLDTALPTVGLKKGFGHRVSPRCREEFARSMEQTVSALYNHPCVCYYTIFNEGWGQHDGNSLYARAKKLDPTRIWDTASGWFKGVDSDVDSEHVYFKKIKLTARVDKPLVLSEFGGYACRVDGHCANADKAYGYKTMKNESDFEARLCELYRNEIVHAIENGLCAAVLTQVSDVEDEINGLVTYDRQRVKVTPEAMGDVASELHEVFGRKTE